MQCNAALRGVNFVWWWCVDDEFHHAIATVRGRLGDVQCSAAWLTVTWRQCVEAMCRVLRRYFGRPPTVRMCVPSSWASLNTNVSWANSSTTIQLTLSRRSPMHINSASARRWPCSVDWSCVTLTEAAGTSSTYVCYSPFIFVVVVVRPRVA